MTRHTFLVTAEIQDGLETRDPEALTPEFMANKIKEILVATYGGWPDFDVQIVDEPLDMAHRLGDDT